MSANNALHIAVLGGDGIGPEVMAPALEVLRKIEATTDFKFRFTEAPAGASVKRNFKSVVASILRRTSSAGAITSGPMPSPPSTAMWRALLADMRVPLSLNQTGA